MIRFKAHFSVDKLQLAHLSLADTFSQIAQKNAKKGTNTNLNFKIRISILFVMPN